MEHHPLGGAGFVSGDGVTREDAIRRLKRRVRANGGTWDCDEYGVCFVVDANGVKFRVTLTRVATVDGTAHWVATLGLRLY